LQSQAEKILFLGAGKTRIRGLAGFQNAGFVLNAFMQKALNIAKYFGAHVFIERSSAMECTCQPPRPPIQIGNYILLFKLLLTQIPSLTIALCASNK
jgi:hypothetical protein